jgi:hypothetical protein
MHHIASPAGPAALGNNQVRHARGSSAIVLCVQRLLCGVGRRGSSRAPAASGEAVAFSDTTDKSAAEGRDLTGCEPYSSGPSPQGQGMPDQ